jgi:glycosyltransferase involved in cell wall biosynthesis
VLFLGPISEDELQRLYEGAAVYVYPAPEEDFGMGVIESMAKGVPVVAWNQAGPTVTVGPGTGHLAEPLQVGDYAAGIVALLDDLASNQATGERAFEWARRFDWERHIDVLERTRSRGRPLHEQVAVEAATA